MAIDRKVLSRMLHSAAAALKEESPRLSEIDSRFGDGDHGVTMTKVATAMERAVATWENEPEKGMRDFLAGLGDDIMAVGGGSAGPLYGTLVGGLAEPLSECSEIDADLLKSMFESVLEAMYEITKARVGDKTMMDALIPAVSAALVAGNDPRAVLEAAACAAEAGAKASEAFVSKFGRARSYGDRTIGTPDAGAVSAACLFRGLYDGFKLNAH